MPAHACREIGTFLLLSALATVEVPRAQSTNQPPRIVTGSPAFTRQVLDATVDQTHAVAAADFDGDGFRDVVATDYVGGLVLWYRNDGRGGFARRVLDGNLHGAYPVGVGDVDRDGDVDVLAAGYVEDVFVWYENDGKGAFRRHNVGSSDGAHSIVTADLDRDGDIDLVTTSQDANQVAWYENDGKQSFQPRVIDTSASGAKRAEPADLDGDGDLDVVAASYFANEVAWYQNDGSRRFTKYVIDAKADGAYYVTPADIDGDGDVDVLAVTALGNTLVCYENNGRGAFQARVIDASAAGARTVAAADIDGDGRLDPLAASVDDDTVAWHANLGCRGFEERVVDASAEGAYGVAAADMDGDGDVDVLAATRDDDTIALHTQIQRQAIAVAFGGRRVIDASVLMTIDPDDGPADLIYTLAEMPAQGRLELDGQPLPVTGKFRQADVDLGRVVYVHGGRGSAPDRFSFTVQDGGENGVRPAAGDFAIAVTGAADWVVELPLDEGSGTLARDASGNGKDGRLVNGPVFEANTADGSAFAVRFDGQDDYLDLGALDAGGQGLTLAIWLNADTFPGDARDPRLISKAAGVDANQHVFMLSTIAVGPATRLRARVRIAGQTTTLVATRGELRPGVWHHAAVTYDGVAMRLYQDGLEVGSTTLTGTVDVDPRQSVAIGGQPPGAGIRFFDGLLDDARILRRALDASEVAALATGCRRLFRAYGAGLAGSLGITPRLSGWGCPRLGQVVAIDVSRGLPGAPGLVFFGITPVAAPALGGWALVAPLLAVPVALSSSGGCSGSASLPLSIPSEPGLIGRSVFWQGLLLDRGGPQGASLTAGLEMVFGR